MKQTRSAALAALTLVAGCGGGSALLALLPYVEPIGGQWVLQSDDQTTISPQDDCLKDASGAPVAGFVGDDGQLRATTIAAAARAQELAIVGDLVRVFVAGETGMTAATLCAE